MAKHSDWYFRDWEERAQIDAKGKTKIEYVYTGAYYLLPAPLIRTKLRCLTSFLLYFVCMLWINLTPVAIGAARETRALCLLALAPTIFWLLGTASLLFAPARMTYRRYHQSYRRLKIACPLSALCSLVAFDFLIYTCIKIPGQDIPFLFWPLLIIASACGTYLAIWLLAHKCSVEK